MNWIPVSERMPEEGQSVFVTLHSWSRTTSGEVDHGVRVLASWFTRNPYGSERGHFIDGFCFDDDAYPGTLHRPATIKYWRPIEHPPIPEDA